MRGYSYSEQVSRRKFLTLCLFVFILTIVAYNLITIYLFKTYKIESETMQPTVNIGDFVIITPLFNASESARRGELVMRKPLYKANLNLLQKFANGVSNLFTLHMYKPFSLNKHPALKKSLYRIVALPGDSIYIDNYILHVKPAKKDHFLTEFELAEIDYNINVKTMPTGWAGEIPFSGNMNEITLAQDEYFLLCDSRVGTMDSRAWGAVNSKEIEGKVLLRYWPIKKIHRLDGGGKNK